jgi:hypothetical protein
VFGRLPSPAGNAIDLPGAMQSGLGRRKAQEKLRPVGDPTGLPMKARAGSRPLAALPARGLLPQDEPVSESPPPENMPPIEPDELPDSEPPAGAGLRVPDLRAVDFRLDFLAALLALLFFAPARPCLRAGADCLVFFDFLALDFAFFAFFAMIASRSVAGQV